MLEFMLHHTHRPEQCQEMFDEWSKPGPHDVLKGKEFFCTCPSGEHGSFMAFEAVDADAALALMPTAHRASTRVYGGETMIA